MIIAVTIFLVLLMTIMMCTNCVYSLKSFKPISKKPRYFSNSARISARMSISEIDYPAIKILIPTAVTTSQWNSYWGLNKPEILKRILESFLVAYGGAWMAWFLSFMAGSFVASIVGSLLIFNWIYAPVIHAKRRNALVYPSTNKKLHYGLFSGHISKLSKIRRRGGKSIGMSSQEFLTMTVVDESGKELEIITQWQGDHRRLRKGMTIATILISPSADFSVLRTVTDTWVPDCDVWVGDYPYLNKPKFTNIVVGETENVGKDTMASERGSRRIEDEYDQVKFFKDDEKSGSWSADDGKYAAPVGRQR